MSRRLLSPGERRRRGAPLDVVIPAAGFARRMQGALSSGDWGVPKALLEVGRRPVIVEILDGIERDAARRGLAPRYSVVTGLNGGRLRRFLRAYYGGTPLGRRLRFFRQRRPLGPLSGVLAARVGSGPALIWLCDTLLPGGLPGAAAGDLLYTAPVSGDLSRWCLALANGGGRLKALLDKPKGGAPSKAQALIGIYRVEDSRLFWSLGREVLRRRQKRSGEYQLSSALEAYHRERPLSLREVSRWQDTGSSETFLRAKEASLERLASHRLSIDPRTRRVLKRQAGPADKDLAHEAAWFRDVRRANPALKASLPGGVELRGGALRLDYKDWPSLTDWYLYRSYYLPDAAEGAFRGFLGFVGRTLHRPVAADGARRAEANLAMLVDKTERRLAKVRPALLRTRFTLNGRRIGSWSGLRPKFLELARRHAASKPEDWVTLHGDLVFSNVLADGRGGHCLLDPRGSYGGAPGVGGDRYYDYAKLAQCVLSQYDSLKKDEFLLEGSGGRRTLELPRAEAPGRLRWRRAFLAHCRERGLDLERLRFFEAALLLSLLPLHPDQPKQMLAAYLSGLSILRDLR